jgi:hypothetical protein
MELDACTKERIDSLLPFLDERGKRLYLGAEAKALGRGGVSSISAHTRFSRITIQKGVDELSGTEPAEEEKDLVRVRRMGGGRKDIVESNPGILEAVCKVIDGEEYGNPMKIISYTSKSTRTIAEELTSKGFQVGKTAVCDVLRAAGYSLQGNRKLEQVGPSSPDRDSQFRYLNKKAADFIGAGQPVISIDCKKKEPVGNFSNKGKEYRKVKDPRKTLDHDFATEKAVPYGIYDIGDNTGFVNVGMSHDTAVFAVNSIRAWWNTMGKEKYPNASDIMITADCGGSNGNRIRLWKTELQKFADETGLTIHVSHFPAGTSKWNKIEHRMFCYITKNWSGRPLESYELIVNLIGATKTKEGLEIKCVLDKNDYVHGIKVTDEELGRVNLFKCIFHGEWNYYITPSSKV